MSLLLTGERDSAAPAASVTGPDQGVIEEARRRRRRRRTRGTIAAMLATAIAAVLLTHRVTHTPRPSPRPSAQPAHYVPGETASAVLAEEPYMGVACPIPNSFACDRVGLSIVLRSRAVTATATIDGRPLELDNPTWSDLPVRGKHKLLAGFLHPAELKNGPLKTTTDARGYPRPVTATVHLVIDYGGGRKLQTTTMVGLHAGWG
jgi:hypothetical protein